eukprot:Awhi_evm1s2763
MENQAWRAFNIDGKSYFVKAIFSENSYELAITDFSNVWIEKMQEEDIETRIE